MRHQPACLVLMPFGMKSGASGATIDFDAVYAELIKPAIEAAGLTPIRADQGRTGGLTDKLMFERLILCNYAIADLTTADANVMYELGVRHAVRRDNTILLYASEGRLPFDVSVIRALPYSLGHNGKPCVPREDRAKLTQKLVDKFGGASDSPLYQLVDGFYEFGRMQQDVFLDRTARAQQIQNQLFTARSRNISAIKEVEASLGALDQVEGDVLVDLLMSYRSKGAWDDMIRVAEAMPSPVKRSPLVQEHMALALNRLGRGEEAESILLDLIASRGPSSETYGLLGRVYKDRWDRAQRDGDEFLARGLLDQAIEAYLRGFEADFRDSYPGINAVTLMTLRSPPDPRVSALLPVVRYSVERKIAVNVPDYWDYATALELAVIAGDERAANLALENALALTREVWEPETTLRNLRLIRSSFEARGAVPSWLGTIEQTLEQIGPGPVKWLA